LRFQEYVNVLAASQKISWRALHGSTYRTVEPDDEGIHRSKAFPGLWLNAQALFAQDAPSLLATINEGLTSPEHAAFVRTLVKRKPGARRKKYLRVSLGG
jgi:hypothetical protein